MRKLNLGPFWAKLFVDLGFWLNPVFGIQLMYISVYRHVYQLFSCISCFQTRILRPIPVFLRFLAVYRYSECILLYTAHF